MVKSEGTGFGEGMVEARYGACSEKEAPHAAAANKGWQRTALVCAMTAVVCVGLVAALQQQNGRSVALEEEIGTFGTALNSRQEHDTDATYENTFQDDPGHISRAELRFNAALRAAGGRGGSEVHHQMTVAAAPRLSSQWTAFPDPASHHDKETVIIDEKPVHKQAAPRHFGMTAAEARADLGGYFSSIDHQVKKAERQHAQQILHSLSLTSDGGAQQHTAAQSEVVSLSPASPDTLAARKQQSLMNLVKKAEAGKERSLMKLVERAAHSKVFQRALVGGADNKYRRSLAADLA